MSNIVDVNTLATFWGVTPRTVQNYSNPEYEAEPLPKESRGNYDFIKSNKWMYERQRKQIEMLEVSGNETLHALKVEEQIIKNKKAEREYRQDLLELVDRASVLMVVTNVFNIVRGTFEQTRFALIDELSPLFTDKDKGIEIINQNYDESLETICQSDIENIIGNPEMLMEDDLEAGENETV